MILLLYRIFCAVVSRVKIRNIVVGCASPRPIQFMAKEALFKIPVLSQIITMLHAFPVQKESADRAAIRKALKILENEQIVGIFPEGARSAGELMEPHMGASLLAIKANVPILPVAVYGTKGFWGKVIISFGKPLYPSRHVTDNKKFKKDDMAKLSHLLMQEIAKLLDDIHKTVKPKT